MKAYLSSTFADLKDHRDRTYRALRILKFDVIAMEDYVASDERPVDRCLSDVAGADLYVGLFAFRYGYVPDVHNPEARSITELEYRRAVECDIPRLIFLVPENAQWKREFDDAVSGEGDRGERIKSLRSELKKELLVSDFTTAAELHAVVTSSASLWLMSRYDSVPAGGATTAPHVRHPRQLSSDLLLLHVQTDSARANALGEKLSGVWRVTTSTTGLKASSPGELMDLDRLASSARVTAVLLSPTSATVLAEDRHRSCRVLGLVRERGGELLGISTAGTSVDDERPWGFTRVIRQDPASASEGVPGMATSLHRTLVERLGHEKPPEIGLPVVVVAMTTGEATELLNSPPGPVAALLDSVGRSDPSWRSRYGPTRSQWRPFAGSDDTIENVLSNGISAITRGADRLRGRRIRAQSYPLDALDDDLEMLPIYQEIARTGCLVVVDELSLFHAGVRKAFEGSPLPTGEQVAFVTVSPLDPFSAPPHLLIRQQLDAYLTQPARRFNEVLDPLCEMGISERRKLHRWLYGNLPQAIAGFKAGTPDPENIRHLQAALGRSTNPDLSHLMARGIGSQ